MIFTKLPKSTVCGCGGCQDATKKTSEFLHTLNITLLPSKSSYVLHRLSSLLRYLETLKIILTGELVSDLLDISSPSDLTTSPAPPDTPLSSLSKLTNMPL